MFITIYRSPKLNNPRDIKGHDSESLQKALISHMNSLHNTTKKGNISKVNGLTYRYGYSNKNGRNSDLTSSIKLNKNGEWVITDSNKNVRNVTINSQAYAFEKFAEDAIASGENIHLEK